MPALNDHIQEVTFSLDQANLVEASAGTGKTYNIQTLYLRLVVERGLRVQQILVVTFTEAATKELRDRLRRVLDDGVTFAKNPHGKADPRIKSIMSLPKISGDRTYPDDPAMEVRWRVERALLDFDEAAISTIHGFCQRVLDRYAFECGADPDAELTGNNGSAIEEACQDWWRENTGPQSPPDLLPLLRFLKIDAIRLARIAKAHIRKPDSQLLPEAGTLKDVMVELKQLLGGVDLAGIRNLPFFDERHFKPNKAAQEMQECLEALEGGDVQLATGLGELSAIHDGSKKNPPKWTSVKPWELDDAHAGLKKLVAACGEFGQLTKGKRKGLAWDGGAFCHKNLDPDELRAKADAVWKAWPDAQKDWERIKSAPDRYPLKATKKAQVIIEALNGSMTAWCKDRAGHDAVEVADGLAEVGTFNDVVPDKVSLLVEGSALEDLLQDSSAMRRIFYKIISSAVRDVRQKYEQIKQQARLMTFDDLLLNIRSALSGEHGESLCRVLREEYKAALIDEFQDTDPVQYEIFHRVFLGGDAGVPAWLVGDPKQAIYAFRGGDVFTYYRAGEEIGDRRKWELNTNYRSEARLVDAVNQMFRDPAGEQGTFREKISYDGTLKAGYPISADDEVLAVEGCPDDKPFKLWFYRSESPGAPPGLASSFARRVYADTAGEVVRILNNPEEKLANNSAGQSRRILPRDIAILVQTHREAALIHAELRKRGVAAVCQSTGRVFESPEAASFAYVLAACAEPRNPKKVRTALATLFFDLSHEQLRDLLAGFESGMSPDVEAEVPRTLDDWSAIFQAAHDRWQKGSFIQAFNYLAATSGMRKTVVCRENGERALTNLLQLSRLLHEAILQEHLSMEGALTWYARQLDPARRDDRDEYELRLENDDDAVRIMTVFTSKGLEFPIVFVPTLWRRKAEAGKSEVLEYHDTSHENTAHCIHLDKGDRDGEARMIEEKLAEDVRLLYVATTRAKHRTYLVWGNFSADEESYALAWLLGADPGKRLQEKLRGGEALAVAVEERAFPGDTPETVQYRSFEAAEATALVAREKPPVDKSHRHTSFSGLVPHGVSKASGVDERIDYDEPDAPPQQKPEPAAQGELTIYSFPAGAKVGQCWHTIFENLDFAADEATARSVVDEQLAAYRLDRARTPELQDQKRRVVLGMVQNTLGADLAINGQSAFAVKDIRRSDCRAEMQFDFALRDWETPEKPNLIASLHAVLQKHWTDEKHAPLVKALEGRAGEIPQGFLTGFIDLVFRKDGKYYLLDWKSNRRSGRPEDFGPDGLVDEMAHHLYFLQYLIYAVALHQFLRGGLGEAYDYDQHFGGVFYVFLRATRAGTSDGVYDDRPSRDLVEELSDALGRFR